jgi:hypothetical protein
MQFQSDSVREFAIQLVHHILERQAQPRVAYPSDIQELVIPYDVANSFIEIVKTKLTEYQDIHYPALKSAVDDQAI